MAERGGAGVMCCGAERGEAGCHQEGLQHLWVQLRAPGDGERGLGAAGR